MKKFIITSFALIFIFAGIGLGVSIYQLYSTTANLRNLISLHEVEDIRQTLSYNLQKMQSYAFSTQDYQIENLDEIIDNAEVVNKNLVRCHACHHKPEVAAEIIDVEKQVKDYQQQLSSLITKVTGGELRKQQQLVLIEQSNHILQEVRDMVSGAASSLNNKTTLAMNRIEDSYIILGLTLLFTFLAAQVVAHYVTTRVTKPIDHLLTASRNITHGDLGYQIDFRAPDEFQELISAFNNMSTSLARQDGTIRNSLKKLHQISQVTLPLHTALDESIIIKYLHKTMQDLIAAEYVGIMLPEQNYEKYVLRLFNTRREDNGYQEITLSGSEVKSVFDTLYGESLFENSIQDNAWPFSVRPEGVELKNLLLAWMLLENNASGALIAINRKEGDFVGEDFEMLNLLANNMIVAFDNIRLFTTLQAQMAELNKAQRQLIEAEKLKALGTLAGGVAHDFNNILCSMIGYISLLKKNHDPGDNDYKMLDTIEDAGFKAADLTKHLLTFSRHETRELKPIDVNSHIEHAVTLLGNNLGKDFSIRFEPVDSLPPVASDPDQLEQIVLNLGLTGRDAMPNGGEILIRCEREKVDYEFCSQHSKARPGDYVKIVVADTDKGVQQNIALKIFNPFLTDQDFGRGAGLKLAMVYGIVKNHRGFVMIESRAGKGTSFSAYLPIADVTEDRETEPTKAT